ncbi:MAG: hypothetical protein QNJ12_07105 [Ilumatobacter sp.]|uniref:hypothetical protein n=1 Tax=Ilumatobacter sp. TaxID=1967498 RepID=UPI002617F379|nr:hypothetical protein [Ilumatobacter sp.]MDJ0768545.1 hypothetical protein [Ilumatobacter sp.]
MSEHLGIVELADVCERMRRRCLDLFETLGAWVTTTDDPALQRLFATAGHRHAWHADLWSSRRPAVADLGPGDEPTPTALAPATPPAARADAYRSALDDLRADLGDLAARADPDLDPSTHRVVDLVAADVDELATALG